MSKIKKQKILVAMSGGVDSSVAAALLVKQGHDVIGAFMVNYEDDGSSVGKSAADTCWAADYQDALRVAAKLGIPLMRLDFRKEYKKTVLDYMYAEYRAGRTPNPDVLCNKFVKFGAWLDKARKLDFDKLATGHYAKIAQRVTRNAQHKSVMRYALCVAKDENKDQTYFLHQLNQEQLKHILFPIGGYTKAEVRRMAKKFGLPNADKEESMGICFVGERPMKEFLQKEIKSKPGKIILSSGEIIGEHDGLPFYTIGQRSLGVKTKVNKPLYALAKNFDKNELVVGYEDDPLLYKKEAEVADINWISGQKPRLPLKCEARLRHRQPLQKCKVSLSFRASPVLRGDEESLSNCHAELVSASDSRPHRSRNKFGMTNSVIIKFSAPQRAITPGQFAVFYKNWECLGGGVILE